MLAATAVCEAARDSGEEERERRLAFKGAEDLLHKGKIFNFEKPTGTSSNKCYVNTNDCGTITRRSVNNEYAHTYTNTHRPCRRSIVLQNREGTAIISRSPRVRRKMSRSRLSEAASSNAHYVITLHCNPAPGAYRLAKLWKILLIKEMTPGDG